MFRVENADFIADKLAAELLPNQEFREVLKNALEAIERRSKIRPMAGRVEFDVDWAMHAQTGKWYLACSDNGDGMTRSELERYTTTLAVQGAGGNQSLHGNQGMGLKISGPTRHKNGVLIRSMKNGERTMVQIGWNGEQYGLMPIGDEDEVVIPAHPTTFPSFLDEAGTGTVVTFLGNGEADNTFAPQDRARGWLFRYLNRRFFRLSNDGVRVVVRVPTGDEDDWPHTLDEANKRMRGQGKSFNLSAVSGTGEVWDQAADRQGEGWHGTVTASGDHSHGIPAADVHWWVLPTGPGTDVSSRTASGGSVSVLYENELHDWREGNQASPFFARLGILFGKNRVGFVIEPKGETITSDFARAHVLVAGTPVFQSDAWLLWAEQFRAEIPERIRKTMAEEQARLEHEDPDMAKRIWERLRDVMQLLRPRRFRQQKDGASRASGPSVAGPGTGSGENIERTSGNKPRPRGNSGRGIGAVLAQLNDDAGEPATEIPSVLTLHPKWVTERESEDFSIVNGEGNGMHDRAAALVGEDGRTAAILLLNVEFRGYQAILAATNEWANPEGDDSKAAQIQADAREWISQKMIEAVHGLRQLENGSTWTTSNYDDALSPLGLTTAFMADRYHTLREIRRSVGVMRRPAVAAS